MAQNQNTTAGTITTDYNQSINLSGPYYYAEADDGSGYTPCINYSGNNYLILNKQGSWEKMTAADIRQYYGDIHSLTVGSHVHTIKGTFK